MFAKYAYKAGATSANIIADLCKLISGAALADLSVSCDVANSTLAGASPGWTYDDVGYGVVSAPHEDGVGRKVYQITANGANLQAKAVESWNAATHAATNAATAVGAVAFSTAAAGVIWVTACPEAVAIYEVAGSLILAEVSSSPLTKGRPRGLVIQKADEAVYLPRVKKYNGAGESLNVASSIVIRHVPFNAPMRGDGEDVFYQTMPANVGYWPSTAVPNWVYFGLLRGVVLFPNVANQADLATDSDGNTLLLLPNSAYAASLCFGVPRK